MTSRCATSPSSSPTVSTDRFATPRPLGSLRLASWLTVFCFLSLPGCVSVADGPSPTDPHETTTTLAPTTTLMVSLEDGLVRFEDCMEEEGVAIEEIELDGRGRPQLSRALSEIDLVDRLVSAALGQCAPELAGGAMGLETDPEMRGVVIASLTRFASCLRSNGVPEFPDPSPRFTGVGSPYPDGLVPWADEDLATAVIVCTRALTGES